MDKYLLKNDLPIVLTRPGLLNEGSVPAAGTGTTGTGSAAGAATARITPLEEDLYWNGQKVEVQFVEEKADDSSQPSYYRMRNAGSSDPWKRVDINELSNHPPDTPEVPPPEPPPSSEPANTAGAGQAATPPDSPSSDTEGDAIQWDGSTYVYRQSDNARVPYARTQVGSFALEWVKVEGQWVPADPQVYGAEQNPNIPAEGLWDGRSFVTDKNGNRYPVVASFDGVSPDQVYVNGNWVTFSAEKFTRRAPIEPEHEPIESNQAATAVEAEPQPAAGAEGGQPTPAPTPAAEEPAPAGEEPAPAGEQPTSAGEQPAAAAQPATRAASSTAPSVTPQKVESVAGDPEKSFLNRSNDGIERLTDTVNNVDNLAGASENLVSRFGTSGDSGVFRGGALYNGFNVLGNMYTNFGTFQRRQDDRKLMMILQQLLFAIMSGNIDAISTALTFIARRGKQTLLEAAGRTIRAMMAFERQQRAINDQIAQLNPKELGTGYAGRLQNLTNDMNMYSANRQAIVNFLRDVKSMSDELENIAKSWQDVHLQQGRRQMMFSA